MFVRSEGLNKLFVFFPRIKGLQYRPSSVGAGAGCQYRNIQSVPPRTLSAPAVAENCFNILLISIAGGWREEGGGGSMYFITMRNIDTEAVQGGL